MSPPDNEKRHPWVASAGGAAGGGRYEKRHWAAEPKLDAGNAAFAWYFRRHGTVLH